jgi:hypothetical protein
MYKKPMRMILCCAALILSGVATTGCHKIGLEAKTVPLPAGLGDFIAVTPGDGQRQAVLWFKQQDQTIIAVRVYLPPGMTKYARNTPEQMQ